MKVISLGWGTQSFTLAAMVALGELEKVDAAIHADTTHESSWTYSFAKKYIKWLEDRGVKVVTVKPPMNKLKSFDEWNGVYIPAYTTDGVSKGQLRRQCTGHWKIAPIRRRLQKIRNKERVEMWIGITIDEARRMNVSQVKYIENRYPLIERGMTRNDCLVWLKNNGIDIPKRSSCVFCPFHTKAGWREIRESKMDWKQAVKHDLAIRKIRPPYDLFVCNQRKPLTECDFDNLEDKGQVRLF